MKYLKRAGWTLVLIFVGIVKAIVLVVLCAGWSVVTAATEARRDLADLWMGKAD